MKQLHWSWLVWLIWLNSSDLPQLTTFTIGDKSFYKTTSITLSSTLTLSFSTDVPFTNGKYTKSPYSGNWTFQHITSSSITSDSSTPSPPSSLSLSTPQIRHSQRTRQIVTHHQPQFASCFLLLNYFPYLFHLPFHISFSINLQTLLAPCTLTSYIHRDSAPSLFRNRGSSATPPPSWQSHPVDVIWELLICHSFRVQPLSPILTIQAAWQISRPAIVLSSWAQRRPGSTSKILTSFYPLR